MIILKEFLHIASAHTFKIKDLDSGKIVWEDTKSSNGYEEMIEEYQDYEVVGVRARSVDLGKDNMQSVLVVEIQDDGLL
jgi:hypothetical protein